MFTIATWNVNSIKVRAPQLREWLDEAKPDVIALQEIKTINDAYPLADFQACGYESVVNGQKTYNGVAILSRFPIAEDVVMSLPDYEDEQRRVLAVTINGVRIVNVYVPNGQSVGSDKYEYKLVWLAKLREFLAAQLLQYPNLVVLGDFNIAPDDRDVHDPIAWQGNVLVSEPERLAYQQLIALGLVDLFRCYQSETGHYSWWDYRMAAFRRNLGMRIDLILASQALVSKAKDCRIDKAPRKLERPSDHTIVLAEFDL